MLPTTVVGVSRYVWYPPRNFPFIRKPLLPTHWWSESVSGNRTELEGSKSIQDILPKILNYIKLFNWDIVNNTWSQNSDGIFCGSWFLFFISLCSMLSILFPYCSRNNPCNIHVLSLVYQSRIFLGVYYCFKSFNDKLSTKDRR